MVANNRPSPDTIEAWDEITHIDAAEPTKVEILADLRQALTEALAGDFRPALEVLDEMDSEIADNADHGSPPANIPQARKVPQKEIPSSNH